MSLGLQGKKILVTREKDQAKEFTERIRQQSGISLEIPLIRFQFIDNESNKRYFKDIQKFDWVLLTSANGVKYFFEAVRAYEIPKSNIRNLHFAVVGAKTDQALNHYGHQADFIPSTYTGQQMVNQFLQQINPKYVCVVQGNKSKPTITNELTDANIPFQAITLYQTAINEKAREPLNSSQLDDIDVVTFTSPSTIDAFLNLLQDRKIDKWFECPCLCIGPTTKKRAQEKGFKTILMPAEHTIEGMVQQLIQYFK